MKCSYLTPDFTLHRGTWPPASNSALWNAMIHPLLRTVIKGAIWYQGEAGGLRAHHLALHVCIAMRVFVTSLWLPGESNAFYNKDKYNCSFPAMIDDWRMAFHQASGGQTEDDFPFGFVQVSNTCIASRPSNHLIYPSIHPSFL